MMSIVLAPIGGEGPFTPWGVNEGTSIARFVAAKSGPKGMSDKELSTVLSESKDILSHGTDPHGPVGESAILVVGYVQSGKTLSFTAVAALARDNGFGIVILLAGTTNELKNQSEDRLAIDLALSSERDWRLFANPDSSDTSHDELSRTLSGWKRFRDGKTQHAKPAVLITVLKHAKRINDAADALGLLDLTDVPVLLIDDESDQAGLNTQARKNLLSGSTDESGTYESILSLRSAIPKHTMLQYTATPQANLLVPMSDSLNARYAKVISPGIAYTGGKVFFEERRDLLVSVSNAEIVDPKNPFSEPPAMLQESLRTFLLAISAPPVEGAPKNYSMMVQPHQYKDVHKQYRDWVQSMLSTWEAVLFDDDQGARDELRSEFSGAYARLAETVVDLPPIDDMLDEVGDVISDIRVVVVNSAKDAQKKIDWSSWDYWILIGGQKLDRGFTVEGLITTYMPRAVSDNADVLQQRARFFGYKRNYLELCRLFMTAGLTSAFTGYVKDEDHLRDSLAAHAGQPLSEWKRDFIVDEAIARPTRSNVIGRHQKLLPLKKGWVWPKSMHLNSSSVALNNLFADSLINATRAEWQSDADLPGVVDRRDPVSNHAITDLTLDFFHQVMAGFRFSAPEDALLATAIELALTRLARDDSSSVGDLFFMNDLDVATGTGRRVSVLRDNIHVGESPKDATLETLVYSGDRSVVREEHFGIQLRRLAVIEDGRKWSSVVWPAFYLPPVLRSRAWLEFD